MACTAVEECGTNTARRGGDTVVEGHGVQMYKRLTACGGKAVCSTMAFDHVNNAVPFTCL